MRAVKKPIPIEVVTFDPTPGAMPANINTRIRPGDEGPTHELWNELHQSWVGINQGDVINVNTPGDFYPITQEVFAKTYDVLPDGDLVSA